MNQDLTVAVVGATGAVGREMLAGLAERGLPAERISAFASKRSEGKEVEYGPETLEVEQLAPDSFRGKDLVLLATPADVSRRLAPTAQMAGAWVVDVSPAFRKDGTVPLVLPGLNLDTLQPSALKGRIVCCPSAVTTALALILAPLQAQFGVAQVQVTALMAASSAGIRGVDELEKQTAGLLSGRDSDTELFPHRVGFNLIPQVGPFLENSAWTEEEAGWTLEVARLFVGRGDTPVVAGTAIQVPTFFGHGLSLNVRLRNPAALELVRTALKGSASLKLLDTPSEKIYPMPMLVTGDPTVLVGRLRHFPQGPEWLTLFASVDNANRGAALNALETGAKLCARPV